MLRKFSPAGAIIILLCLTALVSCNDHFNNGGPDNGAASIDTARAAQQVIPIQQAVSFQRSFLATREEISKRLSDTFLIKNFNLPNSESFSKDALLLLLSQPGADGIRFYYGKDAKGQVKLVLLPINKDGKDIYNKLIATSSTKRNADSAAKSNAAAATADANESDADAVENRANLSTLFNHAFQ